MNWKAVRDSLRPRAAEARTSTELRAVLTAMIGTLNQSHFSIIPGDNGDASASSHAPVDHSGGIGATIRAVNGTLLITAVRGSGAADQAGLKPGFEIAAIDGCRVTPALAAAAKGLEARHGKLEAWRVGNFMLSGPAGDTVHVTARDSHGDLKNFAVAREAPRGSLVTFGNLPPLPTHLEFVRKQIAGKTVGVISFNIWMTVLSESFAVAMDSLRDADAIVLDMRGNFGGIGMMSAGIAGHFVDSALTLGTMFQRGMTQKFVINPQRVDRRNRRVQPFSGPLALVVDELSVSTTEIFAGGLQSLGRARVFGAQSAGQALPAAAEKLPNGDVLLHAIGNFLLPTGRAVEGVGVTPDVAAPVTREQLLRGADSALDAALAWAATASTSVVKTPNRVP